MTGGGLFDESELRRVLRLEGDELPPRLDAAAIALAAREEGRDRFVLAAVPAVVGATALAAALVWQQLFALAPLVGPALLGVAVAGAAALAAAVVPLAETASDPAVPLSLLAALGVVIVRELIERREHAHVHAS